MTLEIIQLNGQEVCLLLGRIKNEEADFASPSEISKQAVPLLLRLFLMFNELVENDGIKDGELALGITEQDGWILRKVVNISDIDAQGKPIGLLLLKKIHQVLLNYRLPKLNVRKFFGFTTETEQESWCEKWLRTRHRSKARK